MLRSILLCLLILVPLLVLASANRAWAARLSVLQLDRFDDLNNGSIDVDAGTGHNLGPDGDVVCNLLLEGPIERGDLDNLKQAIGHQRTSNFDKVPRLCLHSPGGSYGEGLDIATYLMKESIGTAVPRDAECYSACAVVFMGGTYPWKGELNRFLHVQGVLGFHAPYIPDRNDRSKTLVDEAKVRLAFSDGIRAMSAFMQLGVGNPVKRITPELMQEMMAQGPEEFFFVDTIGKAIRFRIHLTGIAQIPALDDRGVCNACTNMNYGAHERYGPGGDSELCKGLSPAVRKRYATGIRLITEVAPRGGNCSVDIVSKNQKVSRWSFVNDDRNEFGDGLELAFWFLHAPSTPLASLAVPAANAPAAPEPTTGGHAGDDTLLRRLGDFVVTEYLGHGRPDHQNRAELYAPRVTYFDKGEISRAQVMAEKQSYYRRWPKRTYELIPDTLRAEVAADRTFDITFRYTFDVSGGRESRRGIAVARLGVVLSEGGFTIVREAGDVEKRF